MNNVVYVMGNFSDNSIMQICLLYLCFGFGLALFFALVFWAIFSAVKFFYKLIRP